MKKFEVFPKNPYSGKFIVFEGLDGSGQTTQAKLLATFLKQKNFKIFLTKEPTLDSPFGKKINQALLKEKKLSPFLLQKLFALDRKWHLENKIIPCLKKGYLVISDRYFFSSFAFGQASGLSLRNLIKINKNFLYPDLIFLLKVAPKKCIERIKKRGQKISLFEKEKFLKRVWGFYKTFPKKFKNVILIEAEDSIFEVFGRVREKIKKFLPNFFKNS